MAYFDGTAIYMLIIVWMIKFIIIKEYRCNLQKDLSSSNSNSTMWSSLLSATRNYKSQSSIPSKEWNSMKNCWPSVTLEPLHWWRHCRKKCYKLKWASRWTKHPTTPSSRLMFWSRRSSLSQLKKPYI